MYETDNMLSVLEGFTLTNPDDVAQGMADDFRRRRVEKGLTREAVAKDSGVALANIARFELKGLISLKNLILLAMSLGYVSEIKNVFAKPKYSTMEELMQIRHNMGKTKAYNRRKNEKD
ncbi:MAG: helix-turn-helix transcriptional regulator [Duncaniella sp.]|nr:helix-turn-helix transcriptional regulator [Duncaniella sp.]